MPHFAERAAAARGADSLPNAWAGWSQSPGLNCELATPEPAGSSRSPYGRRSGLGPAVWGHAATPANTSRLAPQGLPLLLRASRLMHLWLGHHRRPGPALGSGQLAPCWPPLPSSLEVSGDRTAARSGHRFLRVRDPELECHTSISSVAGQGGSRPESPGAPEVARGAGGASSPPAWPVSPRDVQGCGKKLGQRNPDPVLVLLLRPQVRSWGLRLWDPHSQSGWGPRRREAAGTLSHPVSTKLGIFIPWAFLHSVLFF